jgi:hypothetical protein
MSESKKNTVKAETQAAPPAVEPTQDAAAVTGKTEDTAKPVRTRLHRGQTCPITKTTRDTRTGAIHDHVIYTRSVINRRTGEQTAAQVGKKLRRPGTGSQAIAREEVIEE